MKKKEDISKDIKVENDIKDGGVKQLDEKPTEKQKPASKKVDKNEDNIVVDAEFMEAYPSYEQVWVTSIGGVFGTEPKEFLKIVKRK